MRSVFVSRTVQDALRLERGEGVFMFVARLKVELMRRGRALIIPGLYLGVGRVLLFLMAILL